MLALPLRGSESNQIANLEVPAGREYVDGATCRWLTDAPALDEPAGAAADAGYRLSEVQVLTQRLGPDGRLTRQPPAGRWLVLRFGCTLLGERTKSTSPGSKGYEIDFFSPEAFDYHFARTAKPLLEDAKRVKARSLKYFHVDSYESGNPSWSPRFAQEFEFGK